MNPGSDERLVYRDLAGQGARIVRTVAAGSLPRLAAVAPGRGDLRVEMQFDLGGDGRPRVRGSVAAELAVTCQRCLERLDRRISLDFDLCIITDASVASDLADDGADVLVAGSDTVTIADVVEDELLMELPERLCREEPCPHAPGLSYPADAAAPTSADDNPFHVLSELKR